MKNTSKLAISGLTLALAFTAAPQIRAADLSVTKYVDSSSPNLGTPGTFGSSGPISLTDLAVIILSALGSLL
jgi:hypothetical protein